MNMFKNFNLNNKNLIWDDMYNSTEKLFPFMKNILDETENERKISSNKISRTLSYVILLIRLPMFVIQFRSSVEIVYRFKVKTERKISSDAQTSHIRSK